MKAKTGPIAWFLYVLLRCLFTVFQLFPLEWNLATARVLGRLWPLAKDKHLKKAKLHLAAAYRGEKSAEEIDHIARRCLQSFTMFMMEFICLPRMLSKTTWSRYVSLTNFDEALAILLNGRGAILVTGHYGAFELPGYLLACLGFDVVGVMRPLDNVYFNDFVVNSRRRHGLRLLNKKGATQDAEKYLDDGYLLGVIGDQDARSKRMFVDFFGQKASTYKSVGLLAMAKDVPIIVGYARRCGDAARYEVGVTRIIYPAEWAKQSDPLRWITQTYTAAIETAVREEPDQYLWIHQRWKSQPRKRPEKSASLETSEAG